MGTDSAVVTAIRYGLDGPDIESQWGEIFRFIQTGSGSHPASFTMGTVSFPGGKSTGTWRLPRTPFSA
jgi:hypothetical protein